jgi:hypothetical protein
MDLALSSGMRACGRRARAASGRRLVVAGRLAFPRCLTLARGLLLASSLALASGLALAVLGGAGLARAHPLAPALLELRERSETAATEIEVRFRTSLFVRSRAAAARLAPVLPGECRPRGQAALVEEFVEEGSGLERRFTVVCPGGLSGREVGVDGLPENGIAAVVRIELADGRRVQAILQGGQSRLRVPERPARAQVAVAYLELGVRHIFGGLDHLLFVFGLVLLVGSGSRRTSRLLVTLTAFTLGHCVTLAAATLDWLRVPGPPVEFAIAASVLALAWQLARRRGAPAGATLPWLLAAGFGLLHGLGFAGALVEIGLPQGEIPLALLAFNVGIEVGQLAFVVLVLALSQLGGALGGKLRLPGFARWIPVYAMGALAGMWCIERAAALAP